MLNLNFWKWHFCTFLFCFYMSCIDFISPKETTVKVPIYRDLRRCEYYGAAPFPHSKAPENVVFNTPRHRSFYTSLLNFLKRPFERVSSYYKLFSLLVLFSFSLFPKQFFSNFFLFFEHQKIAYLHFDIGWLLVKMCSIATPSSQSYIFFVPWLFNSLHCPCSVTLTRFWLTAYWIVAWGINGGKQPTCEYLSVDTLSKSWLMARFPWEKEVIMTRTQLYSQLATLTDAQLESVFRMAQVMGVMPIESNTSSKASKSVDKALVQTVQTPVVASKPDKFSYKSLRCTKGIPSKVWSAIHHCVVENGGEYDRKTKTWTFKTIKACKATYDAQVAYAKAHDKDLCIEAF